MRANHPRSEFGRRKAELFNERFALGDLVAVRRVPGEPATWDRVFAPAYGAGDGAMVELASSLVPVDTDIVFDGGLRIFDAQIEALKAFNAAGSPAQGENPGDYTRVSIRSSGWMIVCAFVLGFAAAVLLAFVQPVRSAMPASYAPAEITSGAGETA